MEEMQTEKFASSSEHSVMDMTLAQLKEDAIVITQDRRNQTLSFEWESEDALIEVKITKKMPSPAESLIDQIDNPKEKVVVQRLINGDKQVDIAEDLHMSQTTVSTIKKKHAKTLAALLSISAATSPLAMMPGALTAITALANHTRSFAQDTLKKEEEE